MTVICTKTYSCFEKDLKYELILEHPFNYAIFNEKGEYELVIKDNFKRE